MTTGEVSAGRLERSLLVVAIVALGYCAWARLDSSAYQRWQGLRLESLLHRGPGVNEGAWKPGVAVAARSEARSSGLVGRVSIPRLQVLAVIAEGIAPDTLRRAVGHVPGTAFPGESGNVVLAGHRDSFFSGLRDIRIGDRVQIDTPDGQFQYDVISKEVVGDTQGEILLPTKSPTLTLITCFPFRYLGPAPNRFIVRARPAAFSGRSPGG